MQKVLLVLSVLILSSLACMQQATLSTPTKAPTQEPTALTVTSQAPKPTPTESARSCKVTAQEALNLRSGAGISSGVIGWLSPGELLALTNSPARGNWIEVITETGAKGWINSNYCEGYKHHEK